MAKNYIDGLPTSQPQRAVAVLVGLPCLAVWWLVVFLFGLSLCAGFLFLTFCVPIFFVLTMAVVILSLKIITRGCSELSAVLHAMDVLLGQQ